MWTKPARLGRQPYLARKALRAVYKPTKHLQITGALELITAPDDQLQKIICMAPIGEKIALDARTSLAEIESYLAEKIGLTSLHQLKATPTQDWGSL